MRFIRRRDPGANTGPHVRTHRRYAFHQVFEALLVTGLVLATGTTAKAGELEELEAMFVAPCCFKQTLDVHASPLADQLRLELRERLSKGEAAASIEADFVKRYGEKVRAVPHRGFLTPLGGGLVAATMAALIVLLFVGQRWVRKTAPPEKPAAAPSSADQAARLQLKEELADLD